MFALIVVLSMLAALPLLSLCDRANILISGKSHRTGLPVSCPKHSAMRLHTEQVWNAAVSNAAFSLVDSASNELDLRILESIYIHDRKPILKDKESVSILPITVSSLLNLFRSFYQNDTFKLDFKI